MTQQQGDAGESVVGAPRLRLAVLLSCSAFEDFFTDGLGFSRSQYLQEYRNDWAWEYAAHLRQVGLDCVIVVPTYGPSASVRTHDGFDVRFIAHRRSMSVYRRFPVLARTPPGRWVFEALGALSLWPALSELVVVDEIDLLYVQEYWTGRFDVLACLARLPLVAADHGGSSHRQVSLFKRWTLPRARLITTQTSQELQEVERRGGTGSLVANAVDTDWFTPGPAEQHRGGVRVLHVARLLDRHKRTSDLLRAMSALPADWTLDVVGTGPDESALRALCSDLGISARVRFHGFVTDRELLRQLYRRASVLVAPSAHEARLLAALEAMASGVPVVLNDIPVFRQLVDQGVEGLVVDAHDPAALSSAIRTAVEAGAPMRGAARARAVRDASWPSTAWRLRALLDRYVAGPDAAA